MAASEPAGTAWRLRSGRRETQERGWEVGGRAEAIERRLENIDEITLQLKVNLNTSRLGHLKSL